MPEWFKYRSPDGLVEGRKYWLLHKSESQKYNRMSLMTFLGTGIDTKAGLWDARPAAGTQSLPWSWLIAVCEAPAGKAHFVNQDARQWSIPEPKDLPQMTPTVPLSQEERDQLAARHRVTDAYGNVTADDILPTEASRELAAETATILRNSLAAQSGRRFGVTISPEDDADVVALVVVLEETAYIVDLHEAVEDDLAALAKDFPAIRYLVHTHVPKPGSRDSGPDGEYAECLGCGEPIHQPGSGQPWYTGDEFAARPQ